MSQLKNGDVMADHPISPARVPRTQPEIAGEKQAKHANKGRFTKGKSGNPAGKPRGTRNRATVMAEQLMDCGVEEVVSTVIALAKAGDLTASKLCLERMLAPRKDRPIIFDPPPIGTPQDVAEASAAVLRAVATGEITLSEGQALIAMLDTHRKALELAEFADKLDRLEEHAGLDK